MYCSYCGTSNRDEDKICQKCGKLILSCKENLSPSNLKIGWMMWWRAFLPLLVLGGLFAFRINILVLIIIFFPISLFLLDWAGKSVARKEHNVVATKMYIIPLPLTTAFFSLSNIGAGIWWRMILFNIILFPLSFASSFLFSALPIAGFASFLALIFLQILILGWVTNRTIKRLSQKSQQEKGENNAI